MENLKEYILSHKGAKIFIGLNEVYKSIIRGNADVVIISEDIYPQNLTFPLKNECSKKEGVKCIFGGITRNKLAEYVGVNNRMGVITISFREIKSI